MISDIKKINVILNRNATSRTELKTRKVNNRSGSRTNRDSLKLPKLGSLSRIKTNALNFYRRKSSRH